jgi:hypothetical protein
VFRRRPSGGFEAIADWRLGQPSIEHLEYRLQDGATTRDLPRFEKLSGREWLVSLGVSAPSGALVTLAHGRPGNPAPSDDQLGVLRLFATAVTVARRERSPDWRPDRIRGSKPETSRLVRGGTQYHFSNLVGNDPQLKAAIMTAGSRCTWRETAGSSRM